jgi:hypothetical protein
VRILAKRPERVNRRMRRVRNPLLDETQSFTPGLRAHAPLKAPSGDGEETKAAADGSASKAALAVDGPATTQSRRRASTHVKHSLQQEMRALM